MKKHAVVWALVLGMALTLLPPVTVNAVSGSELRDAAVAQAQSIANIPWTLDDRIAKADVTGERLEAFNAGGIFPTTYFEYKRLQFPIHGVMVESNAGTLEQFMEMFDPNATKVEGCGHVSAQSQYIGMDVDGFLADVIARVSPVPVTSLKQALTDESLDILMEKVNLSAASSKDAVGDMDLRSASAAYDKLQKGDLLLAWDDNADTTVAPRIHALVVQSANPTKDEVTVIYPSYNLLLWHLECDACGFRDTYGPSSAALPDHVNSKNYNFDSFKKHVDTYPDSGCEGTWKPVYATSWYTETVNYSDLFGAGVPSAGVCYLPYTLDVYSVSTATPEVTLATDATEQSLTEGFAAIIKSNYRIAGAEAVLTKRDGESRTFTSSAKADSWTWEYSDSNLDRALVECIPGTYELTISVHLGPTEQSKSPFRPVCVYKKEFDVEDNAFQMSSSKLRVEQGEPFTMMVTAMEDGFTGVRATLEADTDYYVFDAEASKQISPNTAFARQENGNVTAEYFGPAVESGTAVFSFVYVPLRTGDWARTEGIEPFWVGGIYASKKDGASGDDLIASRIGGRRLVVPIGHNTQVFRNYVNGYDLVLAYMMTNDMRNLSGDTELMMSYDGNPMYDVTTAHYSIDGNSWLRIYGYIVKNADPGKVTKGEKTSPELKYSNDINQSGFVDIADVQAISNIRNGRMPLEDNMVKWLMADVDRNGIVDADDQSALMWVLIK